MRAEVLAVGTELLLGQIANTNAQKISRRLAEIGVDVHHHQAVGDNVDRIADAVRLALSRSDVVILTGGLGPTDDDVTREGVAAALGLELVRVPEIESHLREKFERLGREMPESNLRQCDVPDGAQYILPDRGTAPGLVVEQDGRRLYAVPGVPAEMLEMLEEVIVPELAEAAGGKTILSRTIRVVGVPEARVGELLGDLFRGVVNPSIAYLASEGEVRIRLTAKAATQADAVRLIVPVEAEVRRRLGEAVFAVDEENLEALVGRLLAERNLTVACAESLTGGELSARITSVPGASDYFAGSVVAYTEQAKRDLLGVSDAVLAEALVSEACAREMARGVRKALGAHIGLGLTGAAGPEEHGGKPPGTVCVALSADDREESREFRAPGDRAQARRWAAQAALDLLRRYLLRG